MVRGSKREEGENRIVFVDKRYADLLGGTVSALRLERRRIRLEDMQRGRDARGKLR